MCTLAVGRMGKAVASYDLSKCRCTLAVGRMGKAFASYAKIAGSISSRGWTDLYFASGAKGVVPCIGLGVTASQLDLSSLTPLSLASCGRPQL